MHIHAQSTVGQDRKVVIVFSGSVQHVAITTSITTSSPFFMFDAIKLTVLTMFGAIGIKNRGQDEIEACADLDMCHLDGDCSRLQAIMRKRKGPRARWIVTPRCSLGPDVRWIVEAEVLRART